MHLIDLVLIALIALAVYFAIRTYRKKGACSCGGSCEGCSVKAAGMDCSGCSKYNATKK